MNNNNKDYYPMIKRLLLSVLLLTAFSCSATLHLVSADWNEYKNSAIMRQYFIDTYGKEKYFKSVVEYRLPRITRLDIGPNNLLVISIFAGHGSNVDKKKFISELIDYLNTLSERNDTLYALPLQPFDLFPYLCVKNWSDYCELLMTSRFNSYLFLSLSNVAIVFNPKRHINCPISLFNMNFSLSRFFFSTRFKELYQDCCRERGLKEINADNLKLFSFNEEEINLFMEYVEMENRALMVDSEPVTDYYVAPFVYETILDKEEYIIYECEDWIDYHTINNNQ